METHKKLLLYIDGMTCVNCQNKIEKTLKHTDGIVSASVSYSNGTAEIVYDENVISWKLIIDVIEKLDYRVLLEKDRQGPDYIRIICMLVIIVSLYVMLQFTGILNRLVPSQLADTKIGYGMLFVIGLITSVHCIAMCGGINLSQCIPQAGDQKENNGKLAAFRPALSYNLGRVLSYTAVGFVLGMVGFLIGGGTEIGISILLQGILKIIAGLLMVIMGINMLGIFPWLRKVTIRMPRLSVRKLKKKKTGNNRPLIVGILNGFMPCGPLQSMWIVALATANPFAGALSMFLFSLGTVPLMLGLGSFVTVLGKKFTDKVMTVGAILVVVLGLAMVSQGGSLSGWISPDLLLILVVAFCIAGLLMSIPADNVILKVLIPVASLAVIFGSYVLWNIRGASTQNNSSADIELVDGVQVVNSTLEAGHYPDITVQAGIPVKWVIEAPESSINGCNYKILISDYDIEYTFHTGENIIEFIPTKAGTVHYSCWMGMIRGNIVVMDDL